MARNEEPANRGAVKPVELLQEVIRDADTCPGNFTEMATDLCREKPVPFEVSLVAGGVAGLGVDVLLFPLDTIKTRVQSAPGFLRSGGFRGIYSGIASVALGSGPSGATFFVGYELTKNVLKAKFKSRNAEHAVHMFAGVVGEMANLVVRVPFEVVKQRAQAYSNMSSVQALRFTVRQEIPFAILQYPLWEYFKSVWSRRKGELVGAWQSSICGSVSGGIAAAVTTPFDVAKTRVMLAEKGSPAARGGVFRAVIMIGAKEGISGLFAGCTVRVTWIALGGAVFFGLYEKTKILLLSSSVSAYDS